jgi:hypothetical protein
MEYLLVVTLIYPLRILCFNTKAPASLFTLLLTSAHSAHLYSTFAPFCLSALGAGTRPGSWGIPFALSPVVELMWSLN